MISLAKFILLPFDGLLKIWKSCYKYNPLERDKLNKLDSSITKRGSIMKDSREFVQLSLSELNYIKNLYETVF
jgi:hypothetical protein